MIRGEEFRAAADPCLWVLVSLQAGFWVVLPLGMGLSPYLCSA